MEEIVYQAVLVMGAEVEHLQVCLSLPQRDKNRKVSVCDLV
jgi:hypothetical protein